jgi:aubergine-like protein
MRRRVFHSAKRKVREIFGNFIFNSNVLYAKENRNGETEIETKVGDQDYKMIIKWVSIMETNSRESFGLIKRFFFKLIKKLKWVQMRKNFYDPRSARIAEGFNFEVWSGFRPTINMLNEGILINLNIVHRVLRNDTALDEIKKMHQRCQGDNQEYREMIQEYFKGTVVLTRYNDNKTYVIEGVDFETKPTNTFTCKGNQLSYVDYYKQKYGISISPDQPLLIHKDKKGKLIHLIPDQSFMTGMTDDMRNNFQLMSELAKHTKGSATSRVEESLSLINAIQNNENCVKEIETWGIRIINEMVSTRALRVLCGNVVMGANFEVSVDDQNLDRAMQKEMFSQPSLKNWVIVFFERDENLAEKFVMTLCDVVKTFKYNCDTPQKIPVRTTRANDWFSIIKERTGPQVQMCVCIIPGNKQKGALYKDVKRFLLSTIPIPSQVILTGTVNKGNFIN